VLVDGQLADPEEAGSSVTPSDVEEETHESVVHSLNPNDRTAVPKSLIKIEVQNFALCGIAGHAKDCVCIQ
jgi:hypothetical protein